MSQRGLAGGSSSGRMAWLEGNDEQRQLIDRWQIGWALFRYDAHLIF